YYRLSCVSLLACPPCSASSCSRFCPCCVLPSFPTRRSSDLSFRCMVWCVAPCQPVPPNYVLRHALVHGLPLFWRSLLSLRTVNRSEEHTSELQSRFELVCRLLLDKKK